jgi:hypothetical protein
MSWSQREFDGERGVSLLLQRLASSPLVRRSLPNAAAIMSEYFNFRRRPQEHIGTFLVRETLGFEEFQEALLQLKEERDGVDPSSRNFDLPEISKDSDEEDHDWYWRQRWDWRWNSWQGPDGPDDDEQAPDGYQQVPHSLRQVQIIQKPVKDSRDSHQLEVHQLLQHDLQFMLHHQGALRRMREQWNLHQL